MIQSVSKNTPFPGIDKNNLAGVVQKLLDKPGPVEICDWQIRPLKNLLYNPVSTGVYRVSGTGLHTGQSFEWSVILKVLHPKSRGDNPQDWNFWKREALAYQSGLLDKLPGNLKAPRFLGIGGDAAPGGNTLHLWLEEVAGAEGSQWSFERYGKVAEHFGTFNGTYLTTQPVPDYPWLSIRRSLNWIHSLTSDTESNTKSNSKFNKEMMLFRLGNTRLRSGLAKYMPGLLNLGIDIYQGRNLRLLNQSETWNSPQVRLSFPQPIAGRLLKLWKYRKRLQKILESLPETLCHLDAWNPNLISDSLTNGPGVGVHPSEQGQEFTTALDWEFIGHGAIGEEIVQLIWCNLYFFNFELPELEYLDKFIFERYLSGLKKAGWDGDPRLVRLGYTASAALRWALSAPGLDLALNKNLHLEEEQRWNRPIETIIAHRAGMAYKLLDIGEEALRLAGDLEL